MYEIKINKKSVFKIENTQPCLFKAVNVYAGDPFYPPVEGKIKNLYFETSGNKNLIIIHCNSE